MKTIFRLLFGLVLILGSFSAVAEEAKAVIQAESYLDYILSAGDYDRQRADIKGNIAGLEGRMKLFDPNDSLYAAELANIAWLQECLGERDKAKQSRAKALAIFETNFYPNASSVGEFRAYISLLNDSSPNSASCAKANGLFKTLFEKDPDDVLIYEFIPTCQQSGIRSKKELVQTEGWLNKGMKKFAGMDAGKVTYPDALRIAEGLYTNYIAFRINTERSENSLYRDIYSHVKRMREFAERLNALLPKDVAAQGLLGSLYLGEYFYAAFLPENILSRPDQAQIDRSIKLLKGVVGDKKGTFPAAFSDLAKAYAVKKDYARAFSVQAEGLKRYPDFGEGAETLIAVYALEKPTLSNEAAAKKADATAGVLIERLERTIDRTPRDYLLIARLCEISGSIQDAFNYIEKGLILFPNDPGLNGAAKGFKIR